MPDALGDRGRRLRLVLAAGQCAGRSPAERPAPASSPPSLSVLFLHEVTPPLSMRRSAVRTQRPGDGRPGVSRGPAAGRLLPEPGRPFSSGLGRVTPSGLHRSERCGSDAGTRLPVHPAGGGPWAPRSRCCAAGLSFLSSQEDILPVGFERVEERGLLVKGTCMGAGPTRPRGVPPAAVQAPGWGTAPFP